MLMRYVLRRACHLVAALSVPPPSPLENCRSGVGTSIRLQAQSKNRRAPRRPEHSRGLGRSLAGSIRCPSLALLLLLDSRDTYPSNKADKPQDLPRTSSPNGSFPRSSAVPVDFQI